MVRRRSKILIPATLMGVAGIYLSRLDGAERFLRLVPLRCPLHFITGVACPTCGLGHSLVYLLQGDVGKSWQAQPLGIIGLGLVLGALLLPREALRTLEAQFHHWGIGLFFLYALFRAA